MRRQGAESCILSISPSIKASKRNNSSKPVSNGQHSAGMIRTSRPESVNLGVVSGAKPLGPRFAPNLIFTGNPRCHDATVPSGDPSGHSVRESDLPLLSRCPCCERHSLNRNIGEFQSVFTIRLLRTGSSIVISGLLIGGYGILLKDSDPALLSRCTSLHVELHVLVTCRIPWTDPEKRQNASISTHVACSSEEKSIMKPISENGSSQASCH